MHGFQQWAEMGMFYNGLNTHTRMVVDAYANGTLLDKSYNEAHEFMERITNNDYQYPIIRVGTGRRAAEAIELDAITSLIAQVSSLANMIKTLKRAAAVVEQHPNFSWSNQGLENSRALPSDVENSRSQGNEHCKAIKLRSGTQLPGVVNDTTVEEDISDFTYGTDSEPFVEQSTTEKIKQKNGASINLIPMFVFKKLGIWKAISTTVMMQLADRSYAHPEGRTPIDVQKVEEEFAKFCHNNSNDDGDPFELTETEMIGELGEEVIRSYKKSGKALGWTIVAIKGISPTICMYKILLEDCHGNSIEQRMPFGLCNALATFQRCMMAIFLDMVEKFLEVFMDDFSVFGDNFERCLKNLELVLCRCEETNLVLNWEKCHFMACEGIILGHKISQ
ncbi:RNA-directed DNA polymerase-like protein [Gossypium australe]|uniref:RNA-directed DNA polymerase-like protein n=1 Tax=Gossypium australe TaxID=47621 RepID=A0A5B6VCC7_9ROSI|nr:RNA-directed DNA polymerase-like protein [Gossypium australe]